MIRQKRVCLISTDGSLDLLENKKPKIIDVYNKYMGGVDLFD